MALLLAAAVAIRVETREVGATRVAEACRAGAPEKKGERERHTAEHRKAGGSGVRALYSGPAGNEAQEKCDRPGHPESFEDLARANSSRVTRQVAPGTQIKPGAYRSSVRAAKDLPTVGGDWTPYGNTPLFGNRTDYDQTLGSTTEGFVQLAGRTTAFTRGPDGALYAAVSNGGIWKSTDGGGNWSSIADSLPTQVVSGIAFTSAGGGALIVLTGDNAFGGDTYAGLGVYRSTDGGATWTHSSGVPDGVLGFKLVVDPNDPSIVYAATGGGLFRSTDGGANFVNVNLPTGKNAPDGTPDCTGKAPTVKDCFLANMVTDVVVQGPANSVTTGDDNAKPGAVLAAVGWRAGTKKNADGSEQSPGNGVYRSDTGAPGTFTNMDIANNNTPTAGDSLTQAKIGRIALGIANGAKQDHRYVYALIMDAAKFNGGFTGEDLDAPNPAATDYLNGVWVTPDYGHSWRELEGSNAIDNDPTSNSALAPPVCKHPSIGCPGIQAWYNLWTAPDPTEQTAAGVPTRLAFGLEEVWANPTPDSSGLDGTTPKKFEVIGRYYGGKTCTPLLITNESPVCPAAANGTPPATTTHPDQHGVLWVPDHPDGSAGGVTLIVGNDGGVYKQHAGPGEAVDNTKWGGGNNNGLHTLQPYDAEMAKDGTVYMGLQDNGEAKIEPNGDSYTIFGGDGFFTAVDPDNSQIAYEEYVGGDIRGTTDGGKNWTDMVPTNITSAQFATPFIMDPANANHLMIGGRDVEETTAGPATTSDSWSKVYDLGTQKHPGDAGATAAADDPDNQLSAVDLASFAAAAGAGTGAATKDFGYTGGDSTVPDPVGSVLGDGTDLTPGSFEDHPFKIGKDDADASMKIRVTWADPTNDWDLYLYKQDSSGNLQFVSSSANGSTTEEQIVVPNPDPGDYVIRVANFTATGTYDEKTTFTARAAGSNGPNAPSAAYVGYCGFCDTITQGTPFANGLATNVKDGPGKAGDATGWHIAKAAGLPSRYITSVRMDPSDPRTVYATLAGYGRRWAFPGAVGEDTSKVGTGHVFKSTDAGETFTDVSGDMPDTPANWSVLHNGHLVVGTDIGVFESCDNAGGSYSRLGHGLPHVPISTLRFKPGDPDLLVVATYGRGVYTYRFDQDGGRCAAKPGAPGTPGAHGGPGGNGPSVCAAAAGFKTASVRPRGHGLRFSVKKRVKRKYTAALYRYATLHSVRHIKRVRLFRGRSGSFTWRGAKKLKPGYYAGAVWVKAGKFIDQRRFPVLLRKRKFHRLRGYYGKATCRVLRLVRLGSPAFGGRTHGRLRISFKTLRTGKATVTVRRGSHRVKRFKVSWHGRKRVLRLLSPRGLRRGTYSVTVAARAGSARQTVKLFARKI